MCLPLEGHDCSPKGTMRLWTFKLGRGIDDPQCSLSSMILTPSPTHRITHRTYQSFLGAYFSRKISEKKDPDEQHLLLYLSFYISVFNF